MRALPLALAAVLLAGPAAAAPPSTTGPVLAAKVGVALPGGDIAGGGPALEDVVERAVPFALDLGYRLLGGRVWGVLQLALAAGTTAPGACASSCSAWDVRFGLAVQLRLAPGRRLDPWVGLGVGVEAMEVEGVDAAGRSIERSWAGFELPNLEAGLDVAAGDRLAIGPYVSYTTAEFTRASATPPGEATTTARVDERGRHRWLGAGVKVTLRL